MERMFNGCQNLEEIKGINNFNTSNVIEMNCMFQKCNKLEILDLSKFNTTNVSNMENMFNGCDSLIYLDLSNFTLNPNVNAKQMFSFKDKTQCHLISNNAKLLNLYNSNL